MPRYKDDSIKKIISLLNDDYYLPDIQRPFIWKEDEVCYLFDSIMKNYPINTFLVWAVDENIINTVKTDYDGYIIRKYNFNLTNSADNTENTTPKKRFSLILDGQQRLTSLYIALNGIWKDEEKNEYELYFNVLSGESFEKDKDVNFEFSFLKREESNNAIREELLVNNCKRIRKNVLDEIMDNIKDESDLKVINDSYELVKNTYVLKTDIIVEDISKIIDKYKYKIWINVKSICSIKSLDIKNIKEYINNILISTIFNGNYPPIIFNNIFTFYTKMIDPDIISYKEVDEANYDKVLDIFVRTNTGGVKLEYSDLLFSKIILSWPGAKSEFKKLLDVINVNDLEFDNDFLIKTCLFIFAKKFNDIKYKVENTANNKILEIRDSWADVTRSVKLVIDLLHEYGIMTKKILTGNNVLIPIIYWMYKKAYKSKGEEVGTIGVSERKLIRVWLIKALLKGILGGQSDTVLIKIKNAIDANMSGCFPAEQIEDELSSDIKKNMKIDLETFLDNVRYRDKYSYLILNVIYKGSTNFSPVLSGNSPEQDHIFSHDELKTKGFNEDIIDSIYNIRLIEKSPNIIKGATPIDKWIESQISKDEMKDIYNIHCFPDSGETIWKVGRFNEFLSERKKKIISQFNY